MTKRRQPFRVLGRVATSAALRRGLLQQAGNLARDFLRGDVRSSAGRLRDTWRNLAADKDGRIDVLATPAVAFLAWVIRDAITQQGYRSHVYFDTDPCFDIGQPFVVLCPHVYKELPRRYAAFQLEQSVSPRWFTDECWRRLRRAECVLEYAEVNIPYLMAHGVSATRIVHVPISTVPDWPAILARVGMHMRPQEKSIDVLFYGDPHVPRRAAFLQHLRTRFAVHVVHGTFGAELQQLVASARVVANIHYYEGALLETTRISESLSHATAVVSEAASDQDHHPRLESAVVFTPVGDAVAMGDAIARLLGNPDAYATQMAAVRTLVATDHRFTQALDSFLRRWPA